MIMIHDMNKSYDIQITNFDSAHLKLVPIIEYSIRTATMGTWRNTRVIPAISIDVFIYLPEAHRPKPQIFLSKMKIYPRRY